MESLSTLMLVFIFLLLCLAVPRMYADRLSLHNLERSDEFDEIQRLLASANFWTRRHFWSALIGVCMVALVVNSALNTMAPHLLRMTMVYTCVSLSLAFFETLFAQKISALLSSRQITVRSRRENFW